MLSSVIGSLQQILDYEKVPNDIPALYNIRFGWAIKLTDSGLVQTRRILPSELTVQGAQNSRSVSSPKRSTHPSPRPIEICYSNKQVCLWLLYKRFTNLVEVLEYVQHLRGIECMLYAHFSRACVNRTDAYYWRSHD